MLSLPLSLSSLLKVHIMPRQNRNSLPLVKLFCELFFLLPRYLKITSISSILFVAKLIQEGSWNRERKKTRSLCLCHHWCFGSGPFTLNGVCVSRYVRKCRIVLDLRRGFRIPISLFQALSGKLWILESPAIVGGIPDSTSKNFSDCWIWIPLHGLTCVCLRACVTKWMYCLLYCIVHSVILLSFIIEVNKMTWVPANI